MHNVIILLLHEFSVAWTKGLQGNSEPVTPTPPPHNKDCAPQTWIKEMVCGCLVGERPLSFTRDACFCYMCTVFNLLCMSLHHDVKCLQFYLCRARTHSFGVM